MAICDPPPIPTFPPFVPTTVVQIDAGQWSHMQRRIDELESENRELRVRINEARAEIGRHHKDFQQIRNIVG